MEEVVAAENCFSALAALGHAPVLAFTAAMAPPPAEAATPSSSTPSTTKTAKSLKKFDSSAYMDDSELAVEMKSLRETNEKIMQQNIALLADVEAMTEQLTRMRNEKAILASKIVQMSK